MYHTAWKAAFQQLIQSVVLTAHNSQFFTNCFFVLCDWYVPGSTTGIVLVCTLHTLWSVLVIQKCDLLRYLLMSLFIYHMEVDLESVVIDYCTTTTSVHHFLGGHTGISCTEVCVTPYSCRELFVKSTFRSFQDVILTQSKRNFPEWNFRSATIYMEVSCMMSCYRHQSRERHYIRGLARTYDCCVLSGGSYSCYQVYCFMYCLTGTDMHERGIAGKCSQCERVQMRESPSNIYWDILLYFYIVAFTCNLNC